MLKEKNFRVSGSGDKLWILCLFLSKQFVIVKESDLSMLISQQKMTQN